MDVYHAHHACGLRVPCAPVGSGALVHGNAQTRATRTHARF